jgi:hypothetical protein
MSPAQPHIEARERQRSAKPLRAGYFQLRNAFLTGAPIANERLIFGSREVVDRPIRGDRTPALINHANPDFECLEGAGMAGHLNAFFAISVNSPSMSMVNFSCCVGSAQNSCARGMTRRVTPQPTRAALRMEAEAHVCV